MLPCVHAGTAGRSRHGCHGRIHELTVAGHAWLVSVLASASMSFPVSYSFYPLDVVR